MVFWARHVWVVFKAPVCWWLRDFPIWNHRPAGKPGVDGMADWSHLYKGDFMLSRGPVACVFFFNLFELSDACISGSSCSLVLICSCMNISIFMCAIVKLIGLDTQIGGRPPIHFHGICMPITICSLMMVGWPSTIYHHKLAVYYIYTTIPIVCIDPM